MDQSLRDAVLSAQNIQAPASTLGADSAPEIAKLYGINFQQPQAKIAAGALAQGAQTDVTAQENAAKIAAQKKADEANFQAYKIVKKEDGGYDFFDPNGKQVDIATLTQRTGVKATDVLKDSENPIDIQYVNDYQNLQSFIQAVLSGDKKKKDAFVSAQPALKKYNDKGGVNRLIDEFKKSYQRYYTPRTVNPSAWGASVPNQPVVPAGLSGADALLGSSGGI